MIHRPSIVWPSFLPDARCIVTTIVFGEVFPSGVCASMSTPLAVAENAYLRRRAAECYESLARGFLTTGRELGSWLAAPQRCWQLWP